MKKLSIIVPCYNEEKNIPLFFESVSKLLSVIQYKGELIFVNDGSKDNTLVELQKLINVSPCDIKVINFSRNFGKEAGIYAGLENCTGDYAVLIDADMQQDPLLIIKMLKVIEENPEYDGVAYYQEERKENTFIKLCKNAFYGIINKMTDVKFVSGASDFRLINRKMIDSIIDMQENNRFSKGIFSWIGFNFCYLSFSASERKYGKSKFGFWNYFKYAMTGIISFSNAPLRLATILGVIFSGLSFCYLIFVIIQKLFFGIDISGYATIVTLILLLGGIQLLVLGIIGEYLARTYTETKRRPIYILKEIITNKDKKKNDK